MATRPNTSDLAAALNASYADARARGHAVQAQHKALAAEIKAATGCSEDAASIAAGSYINCRNMPDYGLSDPPFGWYARHSDALTALHLWLAVTHDARKASAISSMVA